MISLVLCKSPANDEMRPISSLSSASSQHPTPAATSRLQENFQLNFNNLFSWPSDIKVVKSELQYITFVTINIFNFQLLVKGFFPFFLNLDFIFHGEIGALVPDKIYY